MLRVNGLDALDGGLQGQGKMSCLQRINWRIRLQNLSLKPDACEFVNHIAQLCWIVADGTNDAGKNQRKVDLWRGRHEFVPVGDFRRYRDHFKSALWLASPN